MPQRTATEIYGRDADVAALVASLEAAYPVDLFVYAVRGTDGVRIGNIRVPADERGSGIGTRVMDELTAWADDRELVLVLTPESEGRGAPSRTKLQAWYRSFGFVPNKGRNKDYQFTDAMIRQPTRGQNDAGRLGTRLKNAW